MQVSAPYCCQLGQGQGNSITQRLCASEFNPCEQLLARQRQDDVGKFCLRKAPEALDLLELQQLDDRKEKIQAKDDEDDNVNKPGRGPIDLQGTGLRQAYSNL